MADEIEEEEPQVKEEEKKEDDSDEENDADESVEKKNDEEKKEGDDEKKDEEAKDEEGKEGKEGEEGEEKKDDKQLTKQEKALERKRKQEETQKKKEEAKKNKEEEDKKKKEAAKLKKEEKAAEAERKKDEQKAKPPTPKATLKSIFMGIAGVLLVYSITALGIASYAIDSALKFRRAVDKDIELYCQESSQLPDCLTIPEIALVPFYTLLGWSLLLTVSCLLAFHGLLLERTGSFTTFSVINVVLILVQIAITTLTLILADQLKSNPKLACPEEGESGCGEILLSSMKETLSQLWTYESTQDFLGCEDAEEAQDVMDCFVSLFHNAATAVACLLMIPLVLQAPAIYFALAVRSRVIQEQGMDLFAMCRITYGLKTCVMSSLLFFILFGFVVAAIVPIK
mmetsp:Transcript_20734/g.49405  ORF Transcript_20734/g.49405 Transcript_20734/m.49405 type:complete len:399 (-) Transcript_20734:28-1224(-)|eukprot:CAMPEP_0177728186 /NCGR_PEP_ID=MMETSP0484_2-20121128/20746_1 /TAXON_ID=354590 /ORGANISM="Rhodomonas lens, Strain RHODO" /LENGTH=398 /DNA_ID=CAMNT_0019240941 /DNA_START=99 /DNA_END=1295 /DNA_ORIENTATION=+